jgi:hypothetical protein
MMSIKLGYLMHIKHGGAKVLAAAACMKYAVGCDAFYRSTEIVFVNIRRNAANTTPDVTSAVCLMYVHVRDVFFP